MTTTPVTLVSEVQFRSDSDVHLVNHAASDLMVVQAARVSTIGADSLQSGESAGLINFLMRSRHGSPFESSYFRFLIRTPIFVAREFMRHRIASYSERSGRYSTMLNTFYVPSLERPLQQTGKPSEYRMSHADADTAETALTEIRRACSEAWSYYNTLTDLGISREVARMVLPVNVFTEFYVSMNARGLMNFLSLRVKSDDAHYETNPMYEIQEVAQLMESEFKNVMPHTHAAFVEHGRVAP